MQDLKSGCPDNKPDTLPPRLWSKCHITYCKILLIKRNVVLIRRQPFLKNELFHLKNQFTGKITSYINIFTKSCFGQHPNITRKIYSTVKWGLKTCSAYLISVCKSQEDINYTPKLHCILPRKIKTIDTKESLLNMSTRWTFSKFLRINVNVDQTTLMVGTCIEHLFCLYKVHSLPD